VAYIGFIFNKYINIINNILISTAKRICLYYIIIFRTVVASRYSILYIIFISEEEFVMKLMGNELAVTQPGGRFAALIKKLILISIVA
jgi:hypothetical protein